MRLGQISRSDLPSSYNRPPAAIEYVDSGISDYQSPLSGMPGVPIASAPSRGGPSRRPSGAPSTRSGRQPWGYRGGRSRRGPQHVYAMATLAQLLVRPPHERGRMAEEQVAHPSDDYVPPSPRGPQIQPVSVPEQLPNRCCPRRQRSLHP